MFARRRPLLRAAAVGGGAYVAGKHSAERSTRQSQYASPDLPQPARAEPDEPSVSDKLAQLSNLHQRGSLNDAEFAAAKAQLLGS
jgi:Short C-terminal domain